MALKLSADAGHSLHYNIAGHSLHYNIVWTIFLVTWGVITVLIIYEIHMCFEHISEFSFGSISDFHQRATSEGSGSEAYQCRLTEFLVKTVILSVVIKFNGIAQ